MRECLVHLLTKVLYVQRGRGLEKLRHLFLANQTRYCCYIFFHLYKQCAPTAHFKINGFNLHSSPKKSDKGNKEMFLHVEKETRKGDKPVFSKKLARRR